MLRSTVVATRAAASRLAPVFLQSASKPFQARVFPAFARGLGSSSGLSVEDVTQRIVTLVKNFQNVDETKVTTESHFMKDLGLDSLDTVEVFYSSIDAH